MIDILETIMIFCWGLSWPISLYKSWTSRTAKGKSVVFEIFIWMGYVCGIARKCLQIQAGQVENNIFYLAFAFYILNITAVTIDMFLWVRNHKLDEMEEKNSKMGIVTGN